MISRGSALATKGRVTGSAISLSTLGKIWKRFDLIISPTASAYSFIRVLIEKSFIRSSKDASFGREQQEISFVSIERRGNFTRKKTDGIII